VLGLSICFLWIRQQEKPLNLFGTKMNEYNLKIKNSYFEYCDIPDCIKTAVDREIEFNSYMMFCVNEEVSVDWLYNFYSYSDNQYDKLIFIDIARDEYKHFLFYTDLIKELFPEKNFDEEYKKYKNLVLYYNENFLKNLNQNSYSLAVFRHFMNETMFTVDLKYQYQHVQNVKVKEILKQIFSDESKHVALGKKLKLSKDQENIKKFRKNIILEMNLILSRGVRPLDLRAYKTEMHKHGYDINDYLTQIKKSKKSKKLILGTVENLHKFGENFDCVEELDLENFLKKNNLFYKYEHLI
jgi:rubrerythrin